MIICQKCFKEDAEYMDKNNTYLCPDCYCEERQLENDNSECAGEKER